MAFYNEIINNTIKARIISIKPVLTTFSLFLNIFFIDFKICFGNNDKKSPSNKIINEIVIKIILIVFMFNLIKKGFLNIAKRNIYI